MATPPNADVVSNDARAARFTAVATDVWEPLQRYLRRRTDSDSVEDVASETLTVMWRRIDDMPVGAELAWCYSIARRCLANHRRGAARRRRLLERVSQRTRPATDGLDDPASILEQADPELRDALALLSADDRELVTLWAWEQLSVNEIAVVLGASANTVSARLGRARRRLAGHLVDRSGQIPGPAGHRDGGHAQETLR